MPAFDAKTKRVQLSAAAAIRTSQSQADRLYEMLSRLATPPGSSA